MKAAVFWVLLLSTLFTTLNAQKKKFPAQITQWKGCNNCYAVVAYDLIKYHQPRLNITLRQLMQESQQTCNGGVPTAILNRYFPRGSKKTTGSLLTLKRLIRVHGPCVISFGKGHLVTAVTASEKSGVVIRDPADGKTKMIALKDFVSRKESIYFNYIVYPLL